MVLGDVNGVTNPQTLDDVIGAAATEGLPKDGPPSPHTSGFPGSHVLSCVQCGVIIQDGGPPR